MTALGAKSHIPPRLTLLQKIQLLFTRVFVSLPRLIFSVTRDLLFHRDSASFREIWMRNTARAALTLPLPQARALQRPSGCTIASLCKAHHLRHETVELDAGSAFHRATLHFIDCDPTARSASANGNGNGNVLLYFHGGGYIFPLSAGHFKFARAAAQRLDAKCVLLEYTLAPELKYPGQLAQAAAALRYLLQYHDAADITIAGDSAGGNLALALLAHLRDPHPLVRPVFEGEDDQQQQQQLRAALCICPRCANECSAASYTYNASKDIVSKETMEVFNSNWEPVKEEVWATPLAGKKDFWASVAAKKVLLLAGTDEVYVDDIQQFGELLGSSSGVDSELVLCAGEVHIQAIRDIAVDNWDGVMLKVALNWLQNLGDTK